MFKLKKEANLKRNYFITSSRLKLLHLIIITFSILVLLGLIVDLFGNCKKCYTIFMETVYDKAQKL
ncbi:hypothetical protein V2M23_07700, partial [Streptococcus pneumoniae]